VHWLPSLVALAAAIVLTPPILRHLRDEGFVRENYRGVSMPFPAGVAIVAAVLVSLGVCAALSQLADADVLWPEVGIALTYVLGVALLGLIDDALAGASRGWRGHGAALMQGRFSTGVLKAVGALALALYVLDGQGWGAGRYLLAVAVLVLTTNLFNLLDLRPGRATKGFVGFCLGTIGAWDARLLATFGLFVAPILVVGFFDLRARAMLGDTGSNLVGGVAGLWIVLSTGTAGTAVWLAIVLGITVYAEFRSLSALIERTPLLRDIDSAGRNDADA
jgi:UDP-N-acetylmuramyl pentapeptide phosphotransferase/UDP-N-acetylglucosamine-1-phosphate transferase